MRYTRIIGTGGYLPEKILTNKELESIVETTDEWIMERSGIRQRHIAAVNENTADMAFNAAQKALDAAGIAKEKIGMIIVASVTPDTLFPSVATKIQLRLGLTGNQCPAFDVSAACSGFICALSIADQYIRSGHIDYALIVGAEALSKFVDWTDRATCVLLADGAAAAVLAADDTPGVYSTHLHSDGNYGNLLYLSGSLYNNNNEPRFLKMSGNAVFKVAVKKLGEIVDETLASNKIEQSAIDWLIPHQANMRIIQATAKKLNLSMDKVIVTIENQGNTSAASVPLALDIGIRDGRIKKGDLMLLEAFGAGFVWGSALVRY
jgi:3-oxoacyl-[acyl-carrier-protein] synthase III